jgi:uncharacterized RDD family membrane protein YckC
MVARAVAPRTAGRRVWTVTAPSENRTPFNQPYYPPNPYGPDNSAALQPVQYHHPAAMPMPQQFVAPFPLVSAGGRIGASLLDFLLIGVTLGIGWLIWACVTWSNGQTPAKSLLGHVVVDAATGQPFDWGRMFLREFVIKMLLFGLLDTITFGVFWLVDDFTLFRAGQRTLHDQVAGSLVRQL